MSIISEGTHSASRGPLLCLSSHILHSRCSMCLLRSLSLAAPIFCWLTPLHRAPCHLLCPCTSFQWWPRSECETSSPEPRTHTAFSSHPPLRSWCFLFPMIPCKNQFPVKPPSPMCLITLSWHQSASGLEVQCLLWVR